MEMNRADLDIQSVGEIEIDVGKFSSLQVIEVLQIREPLLWWRRRDGTVVTCCQLPSLTVVPDPGHHVGVARLILGVLPVKARQPMQPAAGLRLQPQLV